MGVPELDLIGMNQIVRWMKEQGITRFRYDNFEIELPIFEESVEEILNPDNFEELETLEPDVNPYEDPELYPDRQVPYIKAKKTGS